MTGAGCGISPCPAPPPPQPPGAAQGSGEAASGSESKVSSEWKWMWEWPEPVCGVAEPDAEALRCFLGWSSPPVRWRRQREHGRPRRRGGVVVAREPRERVGDARERAEVGGVRGRELRAVLRHGAQQVPTVCPRGGGAASGEAHHGFCIGSVGDRNFCVLHPLTVHEANSRLPLRFCVGLLESV